MTAIREDTRQVKEEFDALGRSTQIFIACLVGLGVIVGLLLGGAIGYGIAVEEHDGRDCIEYEDTLYCAEPEGAAPQNR